MAIQSVEYANFLKTHVGYRNDALSGITDPSLKEVIDFESNELGNTDLLDFTKQVYGKRNVDSLLDFCQKRLASQQLYAFWLTASKYDVVTQYMDDGDNVITAYKIDKPVILLNDLGSDGFLFASTEPLDTFWQQDIPISNEEKLALGFYQEPMR